MITVNTLTHTHARTHTHTQAAHTVRSVNVFFHRKTAANKQQAQDFRRFFFTSKQNKNNKKHKQTNKQKQNKKNKIK